MWSPGLEIFQSGFVEGKPARRGILQEQLVAFGATETFIFSSPPALRALLLRRGAAGRGSALPEVLHGRLRLLRDVGAAQLLLSSSAAALCATTTTMFS